ncbi:MAG: hypothetical protein JNL62_11270 [Bryobacterales bacterium]|nr:hypothetical protein [Bryobacterales bacterium]
MLQFSQFQAGGKAIPPLLLPVVDNLRRMFGDRLELIRLEGDWLTFRVVGVVEATLLLHLQANAVALFGSRVDEYQATCPANALRGEGVSIRYVGLARQKEGDYSGFWFY